jgi:hypothetical protein
MKSGVAESSLLSSTQTGKEAKYINAVAGSKQIGS